MTAEREQKTLSDLMRELLTTAMNAQRQHHYKQVYAALHKYHGKGDPTLTDVSTTINETLYGENGAWKGRDEE
ncbi:MAG: hypothetical protein KF716_20085 [Anaerolineae bacterium]|nr:hypothetical protein [Anaerolineae bacterium]